MKKDFSEKLIALTQASLNAVNSLNEKKIFEIYTETALNVLDADFGFIWESVSENPGFELVYKSKTTPYLPVPPRNRGTNYFVSVKGKPLLINEVKTSSEIRADAMPHMESVAIIPLKYKSDYFGNLVLCYSKPHHFNKVEENLSVHIGNTIARTITIHRLYSNLREFQHTLDKTLDSIIIFSPKSLRIKYINQAAAKLLGKTTADLSQKKILEVLPAGTQKNFRSALDVLMTSENESLTFEAEFFQGNDPRTIEVFIQLITSHGQPEKFLIIGHDITQRKKYEERIQALLKQKDEFVGVASHELKTAVTVIKGFTQLLQSRVAGRDMMVDNFLVKIDSQTDKLTRLLEDLLDTTRIEVGKMNFEKQRFSLPGLVKEVVEELQFTTNRHKLILNWQADAAIYGDRNRLAQVFTNIINNAIKYSPAGGEVKVELRSDRSHALVLVEDSGVGIPEEFVHRIFERFFKDESASGMGLGLYISKEIVLRHDGYIWCENKPDRGSIFYIKLPLYNATSK